MEEQEKDIMSPENQYIEQMKLSKSKTLKEIISIVLVETIIIGIFVYGTIANNVQNRLLREVENDFSGKINIAKGEYIGKTDFGY